MTDQDKPECKHESQSLDNGTIYCNDCGEAATPTNVTQIKPTAVVKEINTKRPNKNLIDQLKNMLADAESGDIVAIAGMVYYHDGNTSPHWVDTPEGYNFGVMGDRMVGCLTKLSQVLMNMRLGVEMTNLTTFVDPRRGDDD